MKAIAGPVVLLVIVAGLLLSRSCSGEQSPPRKFVDSEFNGADAANTGSCYELSTILVADRVYSNKVRGWSSPRDDVWVLMTESVSGGIRDFIEYTFEKRGDRVALIKVDASQGRSKDLIENIDALIHSAHLRHSTPMKRCADGGAGYQYPPPRL